MDDHPVREGQHAVAPGALGRVHRPVGLVEVLVWGAGVVGAGDRTMLTLSGRPPSALTASASARVRSATVSAPVTSDSTGTCTNSSLSHRVGSGLTGSQTVDVAPPSPTLEPALELQGDADR